MKRFIYISLLPLLSLLISSCVVDKDYNEYRHSDEYLCRIGISFIEESLSRSITIIEQNLDSDPNFIHLEDDEFYIHQSDDGIWTIKRKKSNSECEFKARRVLNEPLSPWTCDYYLLNYDEKNGYFAKISSNSQLKFEWKFRPWSTTSNAYVMVLSGEFKVETSLNGTLLDTIGIEFVEGVYTLSE